MATPPFSLHVALYHGNVVTCNNKWHRLDKVCENRKRMIEHVRQMPIGEQMDVNDGVPARTMPELMAYIRANPGKLNYGTGNGTSIVAMSQLAQLAKLDMVHIPYKGDAPLTTDIIGGRVHLMFAAGTALPHVQSGKLRVVATLLPKRSPLATDAPTMAEVGLNNLSITPWGGLFGPVGLPREVIDRLGRDMAKVLARADVQDQLGRLAFDPQSSSGEELGAQVKEQLGGWRKAVREAGIPVE